MREALAAAVREASVLALAVAVALVWTFIDFARGIGTLVVSIFTEVPDPSSEYSGYVLGYGATYFGGPLTWEVGDRLINFGPLVGAGTAFAAACVAGWAVLRRHP